MVKKNLAFAREVRAIGGVHALEKKKPAAEGGNRPVVRQERASPVVSTQVPPVEVAPEDREEAPLQRKKRLRRADGSEPTYVATEAAVEKARGKRPCSGVPGVPGLGEIDEGRLQEYESSLLDIPTDEEKNYYLGLGYDEAFRRMMMTWGVVSSLICLSPFPFPH